MTDLEENPDLPTDGLRRVKKPLTEREKRARFGDALKPFPPSQKPRPAQPPGPPKSPS